MKNIFVAFALITMTACGTGSISSSETASTAQLPLATEKLGQTDIDAVKAIFNRAKVSTESQNNGCFVSQAVIASKVISFNPAQWSVQSGTNKVNLNSAEAQSMIKMFEGLKVFTTKNGLSLNSQVVVKSRVCNLSPAVWTATFIKKTR